jgi:hypothetical protein
MKMKAIMEHRNLASAQSSDAPPMKTSETSQACTIAWGKCLRNRIKG